MLYPARVLILLCSLLCLNCQTQIAPTGDSAQVIQIFHGGSIITMDDTNPQTEAIAVSEGKIVAVGKHLDLKAKYPQAKQYDLAGQTMIPGVIDSHVHVHELGQDQLKADLTGAESVEEMVARLKAFYPNPNPGEWLIGQGWDEGVWGSKGYPDRAKLDAAFPNNPLKLESLHGFAGFYNGKALEVAKVGANTANPEGGTILKRDNGEPSGVMLTLAQGLINHHVPPAGHDAHKRAIVAGLNTMAAAGVTSVHEAGIGPNRLRAFQELAEAGELPIRVYGMLDGNNETLMKEWFEKGPLEDPNAHFSVRGIKVFYDGSLGSRTALLKEPYADEPHKAAMTERISPEKVRDLAVNAAAQGFQMAVHTIGDEGNNRILNLYESVLANHPGLDHRWRLEHAQVVLTDFYDRAAKLNLIASMQSSHAVGDSKWAEDRLGPARIRHAYAWRKLLEAGVPLAINSDLPGEPWEPMQTLYFAVTRKNLEGAPAEGWYADQALSVEEALKAMTLTSAYAAFQDHQIGSLKPGKFADFVIVDQDPRAVNPDTLKDLSVVSTWVAGKQVAP